MPAPDRHPLPGRDIAMVDGTAAPLRLHLAEHGRSGGGLPLLLLADPPATSYLWRDVARDLEHEWRCFMPDLLGSGASERPARPRGYAVDAHAHVLRKLVDVLALPRVAVVASGFAAAIALELAARAPDRVGALILVGAALHPDSWPPAAVLPWLPRGAGEAILTLARRDPGWGRRRLAKLLATDDGPDLDPYLAPLLQRGGARSLLRQLRSVDLATVSGARQLVGIAPPPTLVLWGGNDRLLSPDYGRRVAGEFGATWVPVAGAGHLVARERPERVAEEIAAFLDELG
jgi:pimeloyl-ACP methyl ester carboxylesterase